MKRDKGKAYQIEDSVSGQEQTVQAESAIKAVIKYLRQDEIIYIGKDHIGDEFNWDFKVTRVKGS